MQGSAKTQAAHLSGARVVGNRIIRPCSGLLCGAGSCASLVLLGSSVPLNICFICSRMTGKDLRRCVRAVLLDIDGNQGNERAVVVEGCSEPFLGGQPVTESFEKKKMN